MSRLFTKQVEIILYMPTKEYDNPYPVGHWRAAESMNGDGTGGDFSMIAAPISAQMAKNFLWSCEGGSVRIDSAVLAVLYGGITVVTGEKTASGNYQQHHQGFQMSIVATAPSRSIITSYDPVRYIHQPADGFTNSFSITVDANLNAVNYYTSLWGYVWNTQARRNAGGPRRF